jgi:hypothetical protein
MRLAMISITSLGKSFKRTLLAEGSLSVCKLRGVWASFPFLSTCIKLHQHQPRLISPAANKGQAIVRNTNNPSLGRMVIMRDSDQARKVVRLLYGLDRDRCKLATRPTRVVLPVPWNAFTNFNLGPVNGNGSYLGPQEQRCNSRDTAYSRQIPCSINDVA